MKRALFLLLFGFSTAYADTGTQPVNVVKISSTTYAIITDTFSLPVNATLILPALTTVTFNGAAQQVTSTYTVVTDTYSLPVSASVSVSPSTAPTATGFLSGTSTITVSNANPLPITGSITSSSVNVSTYVYGTALGSTGTAVGGITSAGTFEAFGVDTSSRVQVNSYSQNTATVTFNGVAQPTTVSQSTVGVTNVSGANLNVNIAAGSIANSGFNVNNAPTVVQTTAAVNGSTNAVVNAVGTQLAVVSTGIPAAQLGTWTVQPGNIQNTTAWQTVSSYTVATDTYAIPVSATLTSTSVYVLNLTTVSFNSQGQPVTSTSTIVVQSTVGIVGTLSHNGAAATSNRLPTLIGIVQNGYGNNGSVLTLGRDAAPMILSTSGLLGVWSGPDITFNSYTGSTNTFSITIATADISGLCGNANKTVYLYGVRASCTQTTAGNFNLTVLKRSSAYTGVWSTMTTTPQDANYTTAQSTAIFFTGSATTNGTLVGHLDNYQLGCMASATATPNDIYISPASWRMKPIVLRGTGQCVGLNVEGASLSGGKFTVQWEWMEVNSP